MILQLFLPEKINNYYVASKRVVGIEIGKAFVQATKVRFSGKQILVEQIIHEKVKTEGNIATVEQIAETVKLVIQQLAPYDELRAAFSASLATYKELKMPFIDTEKIGLVLNYEIGPLIPFSPESVVSDFIVTKDISSQSSCEILVSTVQKSSLQNYLSIFSAAGIVVNAVVVDLFALYFVYLNFFSQHDKHENVIILDLGASSTRMAHISEGQLKHIRTIQPGIVQVAKEAAELIGLPVEEFVDQLVRFGIEKIITDHPACARLFKSFFQMIQLTLVSFSKIGQATYKIHSILLLGELIHINQITHYFAQQLNVECNFFDPQKIVQEGSVNLKNRSTVPSGALISLAVALSSNFIPEFDLQKDEFKPKGLTLSIKQMICGIAFSVLLLGSLIFYYVRQKSSITYELKQSEQEAINALKKQFPKFSTEKLTLEELISGAQQEVDKERETWFAFSGSSQARFLQYLLELTKKIDKKALEFSIERLTISQGTMILKARVKNYEALTILENELRQSPLFEYVEQQNNPQFTMKIILAPIVKEMQ